MIHMHDVVPRLELPEVLERARARAVCTFAAPLATAFGARTEDLLFGHQRQSLGTEHEPSADISDRDLGAVGDPSGSAAVALERVGEGGRVLVERDIVVREDRDEARGLSVGPRGKQDAQPVVQPLPRMLGERRERVGLAHSGPLVL